MLHGSFQHDVGGSYIYTSASEDMRYDFESLHSSVHDVRIFVALTRDYYILFMVNGLL